jgi:hypothetical protein
MVSASKEQGKDWTGFDQARPGETEGCWQNLRKSWQKMEVFHLSRWQLSQVWRTLGTFLGWGGVLFDQSTNFCNFLGLATS